jgi:hypothetical protein
LEHIGTTPVKQFGNLHKNADLYMYTYSNLQNINVEPLILKQTWTWERCTAELCPIDASFWLMSKMPIVFASLRYYGVVTLGAQQKEKPVIGSNVYHLHICLEEMA